MKALWTTFLALPGVWVVEKSRGQTLKLEDDDSTPKKIGPLPTGTGLSVPDSMGKMANVLLMCEQYAKPMSTNWYADTMDIAAIWVRNPSKMPVDSHGKGDSYVWIKSGRNTSVS